MKRLTIHIENLRCLINGRLLLDIPTLSVAEGERIAIVGHNGAGKSTLLKLLTGFMQPSSGKLVVLGREHHETMQPETLRLLRSEIGQVLQGLHLVARLSAIDNVLIGCLGRYQHWSSILGRYPQHEIQNAHAALDAVGLASRAAYRTDVLSGGEKQRVAIARLLLQKPNLILADEPTAALDPAAAADVCKLLVRAAKSATLITVVHNMNLLPLLATRVIGLKQGRLAFDLPVEQVNELNLHALYLAESSSSLSI